MSSPIHLLQPQGGNGMDLDYDQCSNGILVLVLICNHCSTFLNNLLQFHGSSFQNHWTAASIDQGLFGREALRNKANMLKII